MRFCKTFKFERMGAFTYSEEDGTPAASLPEQVCHSVVLYFFDEMEHL